MSPSTLQAINIALGALATLCSLIGGFKAKGLTPDSAPNIRHLVNSLEPALFSQKRLFDVLAREIAANPAVLSNVPVSVYVQIQSASEAVADAHDKIFGAYSTSEAASVAGSARIWMFSAAVLASFAALIQIYLWSLPSQ